MTRPITIPHPQRQAHAGRVAAARSTVPFRGPRGIAFGIALSLPVWALFGWLVWTIA